MSIKAISAGLLLGLAGVTSAALAAEPAKTVQVIVPYSAGGITDRIARLVASGLTQELGDRFVVVNKPGASGTLGTAEVARAPADGRTLGIVFDSQAVNQYMFKSLPYDTFKSFDYVTLLVSAPHVIVTAKPYKTLDELRQDAKKRPGQVSFGSTGIGTSNQLYPLLFARRTETQLLSVPYQGGGGAFLPDLLAGRYDFASGTLGFFLPHVKSGKLHAIATGGLKRSPLLPEVPTVAETLPGFEASSWVGLIAPAGLPDEISSKLRTAVRKSLNSQPIRDQLIAEGFVIEASSSEDFVARVQSEAKRLGEIIKEEKLGEQ